MMRTWWHTSLMIVVMMFAGNIHANIALLEKEPAYSRAVIKLTKDTHQLQILANYYAYHAKADDLKRVIERLKALSSDKYGTYLERALQIAAYNGHLTIVKMLLAEKAINLTHFNNVKEDNAGQTLLHVLAADKDKIDIMREVLAYGSDDTGQKLELSAVDNNDNTLLHTAAQEDNVDAYILLASRIEETKNKQGKKPADLAGEKVKAHLKNAKEVLKNAQAGYIDALIVAVLQGDSDEVQTNIATISHQLKSEDWVLDDAVLGNHENNLILVNRIKEKHAKDASSVKEPLKLLLSGNVSKHIKVPNDSLYPLFKIAHELELDGEAEVLVRMNPAVVLESLINDQNALDKIELATLIVQSGDLSAQQRSKLLLAAAQEGWAYQLLVNLPMFFQKDVLNGENGKNALITVVENSSPYASTIVEKYFDAGADVQSIARQDGNTILHLAAAKGDKKTVSLILSRCSSCENMQNNEKKFPLQVATSEVRELFGKQSVPAQQEAVINEAREEVGESELAVLAGLPKEAMLTRAAAESYNQERLFAGSIKDEQWNTFLHLAAQKNNEAVVRYILENRRKDAVFIQNKDRKYPINMTTNERIKKLLGSPHTVGKRATERKLKEEIGLWYKALSGAGIRGSTKPSDVHVRISIEELFMYDQADKTVLHHMAHGTFFQKDERLARLIGQAVDQLAKGYYKENQFSDVSTYYVNAQDKKGNTPLHIAVRENNLKVAEMLIKLGANLKAPNKKGNTPLHIAVSKGRKDMVKLLILHAQGQHVADELIFTMQNKEDKTAYQLSALRFISTIKTILEKSVSAEQRQAMLQKIGQ